MRVETSDSDGTKWPAGWLRSMLELAVVAVLSGQSLHGYAIAQAITARGLSPVRGGVLYPVLGRLENEGAIAGAWEPGSGGPGRKVYSLTDLGRTRLRDQQRDWQEYVAAMTGLLDSVTEGNVP